MACGTPVITSNISSMPEVCGDAAIYVDPCNIRDIFEKMQSLIGSKHLQEDMVKKGLQRVKNFTWEKSANEHLKVFKEVYNKTR
jgi:glycosyltransferase involved in cell wall biosynthesis